MDEDIIKSLNKIKDICKSTLCTKCPFSDGVGCCIIHNVEPQEWSIVEPKEKYFYY